MIRYVAGSLFDSSAQTIVNPVNTVGVMGAGIALEFKRRYPAMFRAYKRFCDRGELTTGKLFLHRTPDKWILNFPTKQHWRNPSRIEWVEEGLDKFVRTYTVQGITSIAFPRLGCGHGGLEWAVVQPLMHRCLSGLAIPVFVHAEATTKKDS